MLVDVSWRLVVLRWRGNENAEEFGAWLRRKLQDMGPVYIKIGQVLATNNEIPSEIADELQKLQDKADGIPFAMMSNVVLPKQVIEVTDAPIAAASIGIVYRGKWLDSPNEKPKDVAIKVMRPQIKRQMCGALWGTSRFFRRLSNWSKMADHILDVARQYRRSIYAELDYMREAESMDLLATGMRPISSWNKCPNIFAACEAYIVMEFLEGNRITDIAYIESTGLSPRSVANNLLESFLYQCLVSDVFHSDPHPGNIAINASRSSVPYLIWYDSGSVTRCTATWRSDLVQLAISLAKSDTQGVLASLERMGITRTTRRARRAVARFTKLIMASQNRSSTETMAEITKQIDTDKLWKEELRQAFVNNSKYVIFGKSVILVNQNCTTLDPTFNLVSRSMPIVQRLWPSTSADLNIFQEFASVARDVSQMPSKVAMLEAQITEMNEDMLDRQMDGMQRLLVLQYIAYVVASISILHGL